MYPYSRYLSTIQLQNAVRRSRETDIVSKFAFKEEQKISRIEATAAIRQADRQQVLRKTKIQAKVFAEQSVLKRARLQDQNKSQIEMKEDAVRRWRASGQINLADAEKRAHLRREQLQFEILTERKILEQENSRNISMAEMEVESTKKRSEQQKYQLELQLNNQKLAFDQIIRRREIEANLATSQVVKNEQWRKGRLQAERATQKIAQDQVMIRSRILKQIQAERIAHEEEILKSRIQNEIYAQKWLKDTRYPGLAAKQNLTENLLRKQKIQKQLDEAYVRRAYRA